VRPVDTSVTSITHPVDVPSYLAGMSYYVFEAKCDAEGRDFRHVFAAPVGEEIDVPLPIRIRILGHYATPEEAWQEASLRNEQMQRRPELFARVRAAVSVSC